MKVIIAGSSGLIGQALITELQRKGHHVIKLTRNKKNSEKDAVLWDPESRYCDASIFDEADAVVNLAGENIASGRWTENKKRKILESRINATETLVEAIKHAKNPPKVLVNASAIGFYGNQGDTVLSEGSPKGEEFLSDVCASWETAALQASDRLRVVCLRTGVVLSQKGGALSRMLWPYKLGLGGVIGNKNHYMSWITLEDLISVILFVITENSLKGCINATTPYPVTNEEFSKTLGKVLNKPTFLSIPPVVIEFLLGEMGKEVLLGSSRIVPHRLIESGFVFNYPHLDQALEHIFNPT